jgi:hypothetical protein
MDAYENTLNIDEAEFAYKYREQFSGIYKVHNNYLVVHTEIEDDKGNMWSCYWTGDTLLSKERLVHNGVGKFSYKVNKIHKSDEPEFYGIFKDVIESQRAINQALIKIQSLVNTKKIMVETSALPNKMTLKQFQAAIERLNGIIPVERLNGIKFEDMSGDIANQYIIVDKALNRIQRVLHISDSFLGNAFASDSGRKVNIQKNQSIIALNYIASPMAFMYEMIGYDLINIIQKSFNFTYFLSKDVNGQTEWTEMNKPLMMPKQMPNGEVVRSPMLEEVAYDAKTNTSKLEYIVTTASDVRYTKVNMEVTTESYSESDDVDKLMLEQTVQGPVGQALMQVSPALNIQIAALRTKTNKTRNTEAISDLLLQAAQMLGGAQQQDPRQAGEQQRGLPGTEGGETPAAQMAGTMGLSNDITKGGL